MTASLLLRNVRPYAGATTDILIENGRITRVAQGIEAPAGVPVEDGRSEIVIPGLIEAHTHLDKSLWGLPWYKNEVGPRLLDKIDNERENKKRLNIDPYRQSARQSIQSSLMGSTHIRSHVDVDTEHGMWGVEGVMRTRDEYRDIVDIELVAFPQSGLLRRPGTLELMDQAMKAGCEIVGGLDPCAIDRDPKGHLDAVFALCQKYGRPLDIHLHEPGEMGLFSFDLIVERTRALGMKGKVTVSHAFCLGVDAALVDPLTAELAELDIAIMTTAPASRPAPPVRKLIEAGVRVCSGNDGIRDTWGPYGNADMLERAMFVGLRNNFRRDDELRMALDVCTSEGAKVMEIEGYGLTEGSNADVVILPGETVAEAIVTRSPRRRVVKCGKVVARDGVSIRTAP
ncbi:amidohydrolase family protein [Bosea psychrotolerans]|uniref:Cytosine/adenosine deaminase-related metal-dependent hydrolase n=1 Tax=Bosea psychrotolerans TaxID=1871628 RepID=A0A2S4M3Q7_9HYPH|nr:amidohydrolase family protein [Bosea psychrotolerans]POR49219.1 cytosine/adenosine deaminase-related metal-dependent hydrolase [Bosea psychrotolerans]